MAKNTGSLKFIVWRKTAHPGINYNRVVVGTYKVYVSCKFYSIKIHLRSLLKFVLICFYDTVVPPVIWPLPSKATPLIRPDFRCTEIVKYYWLIPLKRGHPYFTTTISLQMDLFTKSCVHSLYKELLDWNMTASKDKWQFLY